MRSFSFPLFLAALVRGVHWPSFFMFLLGVGAGVVIRWPYAFGVAYVEVFKFVAEVGGVLLALGVVLFAAGVLLSSRASPSVARRPVSDPSDLF